MKKKFIYPSTQLVMLLHPKVLKVFQYLLGWQNSDILYLYTKQLSRATKLTEKEVEISIQTLVDNKLIQLDYSQPLHGYQVTFNVDEVCKYSKTPIKDVFYMELLPISTEITWNKELNAKPNSIEDLTVEEIKNLMLRLEASLKEKEEVKKLIKNSTEKDDLPF